MGEDTITRMDTTMARRKLAVGSIVITPTRTIKVLRINKDKDKVFAVFCIRLSVGSCCNSVY